MEAARLWRLTPEQAEEWLRQFEAKAFAYRRGGRWYPTRRALQVGWLISGDEAA